MAVRTLLMLILVFLCLAAAEEENQRKNIKILFVPVDVINALRKNLTVKDLPPGLPGQGIQRWTPVRLSGDKTRSFEIRINTSTARKLHLSFQRLRIGRGHGLLLELKNVSFSTKGKSVLDNLVEFYKNCQEESKMHDLGVVHLAHRIRQPHHLVDHSLVLPGDIPVFKRIQQVLHRFFPKRLDGSVDVFQRKDANGAIHFLPFDEVSREVNNLMKRTVARKRCVKISTDAFTRALEAFRSHGNKSGTNNSDVAKIDDQGKTGNGDTHIDNSNIFNNNNKNKEKIKKNGEQSNGISFARNLKYFNLHPEEKGKFTSSSAISLPSDTTATKLAYFLSDIKKIIRHMSGDINEKLDHSFFQRGKDTNNAGVLGSKVKNKTLGNIDGKNVSNDIVDGKDYRDEMAFVLGQVKKRPKKMRGDENEDKDFYANSGNKSSNDQVAGVLGRKVENKTLGNIEGKHVSSDIVDGKDYRDEMAFLLGQVKKRPKKMRSDESEDKDDNNNINVDYFYANSGNKSSNDQEKYAGNAMEIKTNVQDLLTGKMKSGGVTMEAKNNVSTFPVGHGRNNRNTQPVNTTVNLLLLAKVFRDAKEIRAIQNLLALKEHTKETKKRYKDNTSKRRKYKARKSGKYYDKERAKYRENRRGHSVVVHYKPKSRPFIKQHHKRGKHVRIKERDEDDNSGSETSYKGEGRFIKLVHMRRHKPHMKAMKVQDEPDEQDELGKQDKQEKHGSYKQKKYDDYLVGASDDHDEGVMKARLLRKLRAHGHAGFVRRRKSPNLRVVVYDDDEEEKAPQNDGWRSSETEDFTERNRDDSDEADSESFETSEVSESSKHGREPVLMGDGNPSPYEEEGMSNSRYESNSDSDTQHLSDSFGTDDSSHLGESDSAGDVPDLKPYLNQNYDDEEDEENQEIKMYNDQDDKLGDTMAKRIGKNAAQEETLDDSTSKTYNDYEEPEGIHIHKLPFKIQEDADGVDVRLPKQPLRNALGLQTILPSLSPPSMGSQPMVETPPALTGTQNGMDLSPDIVMPPEQSFMLPRAGQVLQVTGNAPMQTPNMAAFSASNYQPSASTQMNSMMPQTPFSQVSSVPPMQTAVGTPMIPNMQPGQIKSVISGNTKMARKPGARKSTTPKNSKSREKLFYK